MADEHRHPDRIAAEAKMALLLQMGAPINALDEMISKLPDASEQKQLRRPLGKLMSEIYDIMLPIIRAHPDLDPDKS